MSTYLLINLLSVSIPLVLSFDKKVHYYKRWNSLFPAIGISLLFFIIWDILFTHFGVWGFNPLHLASFKILNLPPGEWLFFITVPYSSVFIYDCFKAYIPKDPFRKAASSISLFLIAFLLIMAVLNYSRMYTFITFLFLGVFILYMQFIRKASYMGWFYFSYLFVLIPFTIVNGILTGSYIEQEVVWYNNDENLGIRMFTIPVEDIFYGMLLILMNIGLYEYFQQKKSKSGRVKSS